jgi:hypothetical protein
MTVGKKRSRNTPRSEQPTVRFEIPELQGKNVESPDSDRTKLKKGMLTEPG